MTMAYLSQKSLASERMLKGPGQPFQARFDLYLIGQLVTALAALHQAVIVQVVDSFLKEGTIP